MVDIPDNASDFTAGDTLLFYKADNAKMVFLSGDRARNTTGLVVWQTDGTAAGTRNLSSTSRVGIGPDNLIASGDLIFYEGDRREGDDSRALYQGRSQAGDPALGVFWDSPGNAFPFEGHLFLTGESNPDPLNLLKATKGGKGESSNPINFRVSITGDPIFDPVSYAVLPNGALFDGASRDALLVIGNDTNDVLSLFEIQLSEIGRLENTFSSRRLATLPIDAQALVVAGGRIFFMAQNQAGGGLELWETDRTQGGTRQLTEVNEFGNAAFTELRDVGGGLFFLFDDGAQERVHRLDGDEMVPVSGAPEAPSDLVANEDRLFFLFQDQFWASNALGNDVSALEAASAGDVVLGVSVAGIEGGAEDLLSDVSASALGPLSTVDLSAGLHTVELDLTEAIKLALDAGFSSVAVRLERIEGGGLVVVENGSANLSTGLLLGQASPGVLVDLYDEQGRLVRAATSVVDMRTFGAGTYFMRIYDPRPTREVSLPFTLEVLAPIAGDAHPSTDHDLIRGGDGDDRIVGNHGLDRLFGDSGFDAFRAESIEIRDLDTVAQEVVSTPPSSEFSSRFVPLVDPVVLRPEDGTDPGLRVGVARALGVPVTRGFDGNPYVDRVFRASEVAEITRLDLSSTGVRDLSGLEQASNVRVLNLGSNADEQEGILYDGEPMDGVDTLVDFLGDDGEQHGIVHNDVHLDRELEKARFGSTSLSFGSNIGTLFNTVELPKTTQLGESFTLAAFVLLERHGNTRLFSSFSGSGAVLDREFLFDFNPNASGAINGLRVVWGSSVLDVPAQFDNGQFHHLALTYDKGSLVFYLDGQEVGGADSFGPGFYDSVRNLRVGEDAGGRVNEQLIGKCGRHPCFT